MAAGRCSSRNTRRSKHRSAKPRGAGTRSCGNSVTAVGTVEAADRLARLDVGRERGPDRARHPVRRHPGQQVRRGRTRTRRRRRSHSSCAASPRSRPPARPASPPAPRRACAAWSRARACSRPRRAASAGRGHGSRVPPAVSSPPDRRQRPDRHIGQVQGADPFRVAGGDRGRHPRADVAAREHAAPHPESCRASPPRPPPSRSSTSPAASPALRTDTPAGTARSPRAPVSSGRTRSKRRIESGQPCSSTTPGAPGCAAGWCRARTPSAHGSAWILASCSRQS